MQVIKEGVKVNILVEAKLDSGEIVLKTEDEKPIEVVVGDGNLPKSIEKILFDMKEGETKSINLEPTQAFGPKLKELIVDLPKKGFDPSSELDIGSKVKINTPDGKVLVGIILEDKEDFISVDFNHPLAGKNIIFTVKVVSII